MALKQTIIEALRLINTDGIGPVNYEKYISASGSVADALVFLEKAGKKVNENHLVRGGFLLCPKGQRKNPTPFGVGFSCISN